MIMANKDTRTMKDTESAEEKSAGTKGTGLKSKGRLYRIAGPVVVARELQARMYDLVRVGNERLMGEVIRIERENTIIQVYEDTTGITPGEPVENTGERLSV